MDHGRFEHSQEIRLTEVAREYGRPTHCVDNVTDLDRDWFKRDETVLITAGASTSEDLVVECVDYLVREFGAAIEHQAVREENVESPCRMKYDHIRAAPFQKRLLSANLAFRRCRFKQKNSETNPAGSAASTTITRMSDTPTTSGFAGQENFSGL